VLNPDQTNNNSKSNFDPRLHLFNPIHYKKKPLITTQIFGQ